MQTAQWVLIVTLTGVIGSAELVLAQEAPAAAPAATPAALSKVVNPTSKPTKARDTRRQNSKKATAIPASVTTAIKELTKEFELGKLRQKSDYFTESANADLTAQVVIQLLGRPLGSSDAMDAYVKWQLLSAISGDLPEALAGAAIEAYHSVPGLQRRPGMDMADRRILDRELRKAADPAAAASLLDEEVRRSDALNRSVAAYRTELFARLPNGLATFEAALNDVYERCNAGVGAQSLTDTLASRSMQWVNRDATDAEARQLAGMVRKLRAAQIPDYYDGVRKADQGNLYTWVTRTADPNAGGRLEDILRMIDRKLSAGDVPEAQNNVRPRIGGRRARQTGPQ